MNQRYRLNDLAKTIYKIADFPLTIQTFFQYKCYTKIYKKITYWRFFRCLRKRKVPNKRIKNKK
jgi:hypothetical protein